MTKPHMIEEIDLQDNVIFLHKKHNVDMDLKINPTIILM